MHLIKRLICAFAAFVLLCPVPVQVARATEFVAPTYPPDAVKYNADKPEILTDDMLLAYSAILVEASTGKVIYEKDADRPMSPASTTKIMTVLLGLERGDLKSTVVASETALNIPEDSSTMSMRLGEEINFLDLLYGTMVSSANEGANMIAEAVSGSIDEFVHLMNMRAYELGCTNTHFVNAHGYTDPNHKSSARDLAIIAREAMKNETFRQIASTVYYTLPRSNIQRSRSMTNTNRMIRKPTEETANRYYYDVMTGIKTGNTADAGYCFVGAAERDGVELISVVMYSDQYGRWTDTKRLMEYGFSQYVSSSPILMYNENPITIETSGYALDDPDRGRLQLTCVPADRSKTVTIVATRDEIARMTDRLRDIMYITYSRDFAAPIEAGEVMGTMLYYDEASASAVTYNLIASRSIAKRTNVPKTLEEITAETLADPNPFPPFTAEMAAYIIAPFVLLFVLIRIVRKLIRRRRERADRTPKPTQRHFK